MTRPRQPAPPFDCADCNRRIGGTQSHFLMDDGRIICSRCIAKPGNRDDLYAGCTRAGAAALLELWP